MNFDVVHLYEHIQCNGDAGFSVNEYIITLSEGKLPLAIE